MASTVVALTGIKLQSHRKMLMNIMRVALNHWANDFRGVMRAQLKLGRGGLGTVFSFLHYNGKAPVSTPFVGKHLRKPPLEFVRLRGKVRASQKREMAIQARCAAAGISVFPIAILHTNAKQENGLIIMERLPPGTTVTAFIKKHWRDRARVARVRKAILKTVAKMHALGIVHGDLHGDNLWLCEKKEGGNDKVLVIDFGRSVQVPQNVMNGVGKAIELSIMADDYAEEHIFERWADTSVHEAMWVPSANNKQWRKAMAAFQTADREAFAKFPQHVRAGIDRFLDLHVNQLKKVSHEGEKGLLVMRLGELELTIVARQCFGAATLAE